MDRKKLIQNEQIIRNQNRAYSTALKKYFGNKKAKNTPIDFVCECSDLNCEEPVTATIAEYEELHSQNNRFLIVKGHKSPSVEKTVQIKGDVELVEKPDLPA